MPDLPAFVTTETGKRFWNEFGPGCNALGLLESLDVVAYGILCESFAALEDMRAEFAGCPYYTQTCGKNGAEQANPLLTEIRNQVKGILTLLSEFGMTPVSRQKLTGSTSATPVDPNADEMAQLFDIANSGDDGPPPPPDAPTKSKATKRPRKKAAKKAAKKKPVKKRATRTAKKKTTKRKKKAN